MACLALDAVCSGLSYMRITDLALLCSAKAIVPECRCLFSKFQLRLLPSCCSRWVISLRVGRGGGGEGPRDLLAIYQNGMCPLCSDRSMAGGIATRAGISLKPKKKKSRSIGRKKVKNGKSKRMLSRRELNPGRRRITSELFRNDKPVY